MSNGLKPVIIGGAGPVGLTAARLLQEAGIPFLVIEAEEELVDDLRASTFHPPSLDMLDRLGAAAPLIAQGLITPTWQIRMHPGGEKALFDLSVIADATAHPYRLQCKQSTLCAILKSQIEERGGDIWMSTRVQDAEQDEDGVRVTVAGPDGETKIVEGSFLVGADGSRSVIRSMVASAFEGKTYPETTILATTRFPFEQHLPDLSNVNYVWKEGGTFSLLRLPDLWRCSLYPDAGESIEEATRPESVQRKLQQIVPTGRPYDIEEIRPYRIHMRIVDTYRKGRFVLAGDAAHLNSPSGGMGMNGGIHDAHELVATLVAIVKGAPMNLLDRYTRRRRLIAQQEILSQADRNRSRMQERDPARRREMLAELQKITDDPARMRDHLLRTSMITGLKQAELIA